MTKDFKKGDIVRCIGGRTAECLTNGKNYVALSDQMEGIFQDRPYLTVTSDYGKPVAVHASRFELVVACKERTGE